MSKRAKKCPDCGAIVPASATMCNKCGYKPPVSEPERMDSLPRPVRPEAPRPVETSRWPEQTSSYEEAAAARKGPNKNIWQLAAVLALIVVIIVIAVVLVIKMNAPADDGDTIQTQQSQTFNEGNDGTIVIDPNSQSTAAPVADDAADSEPTAEPEATPETEEEPEPTAEPTPVPTEEPDFAMDPSIVISEMNDTVYVTGGGVNLRVGPGTEYNTVTSLSKGTELKRTGVTNNGWSQVEYNGEECYISSTYVSNDKPPVEVSEKNDTIVVTTTANIRKGPGTEHDVVVVANADVELKRTGITDNGWSRVEYEGQEVYIYNNLIKEKEDDSSETSQVTEKTVTVNTAANIRKGPSTDYDVIATVPAGTELTATGITDTDWYQVKYNDQTAYIAGNLVTE